MQHTVYNLTVPKFAISQSEAICTVQIWAIEHFFRVYIASSKHEEGLHNFREFSQPSECLDEAI